MVATISSMASSSSVLAKPYLPSPTQPLIRAQFRTFPVFRLKRSRMSLSTTSASQLLRVSCSDWKLHKQREMEEKRKEEMREAAEMEVDVRKYSDITKQLDNYPEEEVQRARCLVAELIQSGEAIEERIEYAAENGELSEVVLQFIQSRLELARYDDEKHVIQALDLLYRRIKTEIVKRSSSPALQFLNELLNLYDGIDYDEWLQKCRKLMQKQFAVEDAFTIFVPAGASINDVKPGEILEDDDSVLFRIDFIREVNELVREICAENKEDVGYGLDVQSVALSLQEQQREGTIEQVKDLLKLAAKLTW